MKLEMGKRVRLVSVKEIRQQEALHGYGLHHPLREGDVGVITKVAPDGLAECAFEQGCILVHSAMVEPTGGIFITSIVPPATGWPMAMHCRYCRKTVIVHNIWAAKPERGDYFQMEMCADSCHQSVTEMLSPVWPRRDGMDDPWCRMADRHVQEGGR